MIEVTPPTTERVSQDQAVLLCFMCKYKSKRDWRFPTRDEYIYTRALEHNIWDIRDVHDTNFANHTKFVQFVRDILE